MLGSQSVCITSSILNILKKGDQIEYHDFDGYNAQPQINIRKIGNTKINVLKGPEFGLIEQNTSSIFQNTFTIRQESNRMAYRIGHNLNLNHKKSIISSGTIPGTVQLTPFGDLIFLMRDAQTTGDILGSYNSQKKGFVI